MGLLHLITQLKWRQLSVLTSKKYLGVGSRSLHGRCWKKQIF